MHVSPWGLSVCVSLENSKHLQLADPASPNHIVGRDRRRGSWPRCGIVDLYRCRRSDFRFRRLNDCGRRGNLPAKLAGQIGDDRIGVAEQTYLRGFRCQTGKLTLEAD